MFVKNVTCPVCGSFCDDLELMLENGQIKEVKNACAVGESKFLAHNGQRILKPLIRKNGKLVESSLD